MIERKYPLTSNVGVFAVAHSTYRNQFPGLYETLLGFHAEFCAMLRKNGVSVIDFGMVDSNENSYAVSKMIAGSGIDVLFCNMVTYATSSVFAPIMRAARVPVVLVALQPRSSLDYSAANTRMQLENDNICSVPEFTGVAIRMGKKVADVIIGTLRNDPAAEEEIRAWCRVAYVLHSLNGARIGLCGHVLESMYDMHADPTAISSAFGIHVPLIEIDDFVRLSRTVTEKSIAEKKLQIQSEFDTPEPGSDPIAEKLTDEDLTSAAISAVVLDLLVEEKKLDGLAYYYEGEEDSLARKLATTLIVGNSILNAQGIPMCGEFDIKTCLAMLILDRLDIGGSFAELHPFDFTNDFILVGHDGPHHLRIADGKPILRSLTKYHGKPGSGASVEFKIKEGPITMLGITQKADGSFRFVIGEGLSEQGAIPPTGNTNTRAHFEPDTRTFIHRWVMEGPTHHFALGVGHEAKTVRKVADALGIESVIV